MAFLCIKVILKPNGRMSSQHIHDSEAMKKRGIHCVMDQDREDRERSQHVSEYLHGRDKV